MGIFFPLFCRALLSAKVFAAFTAIFAKIGLEGVDSDFATLIRTFVIIMIALADGSPSRGSCIALANGASLRTQRREDLVLSGFVRPGHWRISWVCYFRALKVGDASKVAPVDKLSLLLVAIFAVIFLHERPTSREWLGIIMIGAGVLILGFKK